MASAAAQLHKTEERSRSTLAFFVVCAIGWIPFVASSLNYQNVWWFPLLLSGRVLLIASALFAAVLTWQSPRLARHSELVYSLLCLALQIVCGVLEGGSSVEFYNFASVFVFMACIFTRLDFRSWLKFGFLPVVALTMLPLFFKDATVTGSFSTLIDRLSPLVSSLFIGLLIGRTTCIKNEVIAKNKQLQGELTHERDQQAEIIEQQLKELAAAKVSAAIAQAAQMLAHDVRKPFSMLRMTIDGLLRAKSSDDLQRVAAQALPDVSAALNQADALIRDVMEVSTKSEVKAESVAPEMLVKEAVAELKRNTPGAVTGVQVSTRMGHKRKVAADAVRIRRVFANILTNAAEAIRGAGRIEITTESVSVEGEDHVRFSVWNSGPGIDVADAEKLFEPFFTRGKSGGTGLGLAIAHKIVSEHGGRIWCESNVRGGVAFCFDLPASKQDSQEVTPDSEMSIESELRDAIAQVHGAVRVLVVDDEQLYRLAMTSFLRDEFFGEKLEIREASNGDEALQAMGQFHPELILLDIDLGRDSISGLEVLAKMRACGNGSFVCIHSNRVLESQTDFALEHGADAVASKPISRVQLMKVLSKVLESRNADTAMDRAEDSPRRVFAFVDDSDAARLLWKLDWPEGVLETFATPEEFWTRASGDEGFLKSLSAVFTDVHFGRASATCGREFAAQLEEKFAGPVLFATDGINDEVSADGIGWRVVDKSVPSREFLADLLT